ncbi:hypothetical protein [Shimia abyssi]|uniref:Uncharacterized protein n=1 Tax=Shimia abyssi TaxID=1662395 RepID=A0A2P8FIX2_9RHOB|nr:hypothetical protein [Shimia abyssi]PSL21657.1 hypothetical protein CLV88_10181 [Shimia abyssi]
MSQISRFVRGSIAACALAVATANVALADTPVTYMDGSDAVFNMAIPDFWTARVGGPRVLSAPGEDAPRGVDRVIGLEPESNSGVWVGFVSPRGLSTLDEATEYARSLAPQIAKEAEVTEFEERRIAGYPARVYRGNGRRDGRTVYFTVSLIDLPNGRVVFSLTAFEAGYDPAAIEDINAIYNSIRSR